MRNPEDYQLSTFHAIKKIMLFVVDNGVEQGSFKRYLLLLPSIQGYKVENRHGKSPEKIPLVLTNCFSFFAVSPLRDSATPQFRLCQNLAIRGIGNRAIPFSLLR